MDQEEFIELFTNQLLNPAKCDITAREPPTLSDIAEFFEFLDRDRTGMISSKDFLEMLEDTQRLKEAKFNIE